MTTPKAMSEAEKVAQKVVDKCNHINIYTSCAYCIAQALQAERTQAHHDGYKLGKEAEREMCAKVAETYPAVAGSLPGKDIAEAIRCRK